APAPAAEAEGGGQLALDRRDLLLQPARPTSVGEFLGLRQLLAELGQPGAISRAGGRVEDRVAPAGARDRESLARSGHRATGATPDPGQIDDVDLAARRAHQRGEILEALAVR